MTHSAPSRQAEINKATFLSFLERVNAGRMDDLDELVHTDRYVGHIPFPTPVPGFAGEKMVYKANLAAVPDIHLTADIMFADDQYAVGWGGVFGTHTGADLFGVPATGKKIHWTAIDVIRLESGKIAERWLEADAITLFRQLGLIPGPTEVPPAPIPPEVSGGPTTSPEENKAAFGRFIEEVWNKGNFEVADELFHPGATSPSAPQLPAGPEGVKVIARAFRSAFPDYWARIDFTVASGDYVCARLTQGGTHKGELMGLAATGKQVQWTEFGLLRFAGGQVVESWYETNMLGLMGQLGVGPGQAGPPEHQENA